MPRQRIDDLYTEIGLRINRLRNKKGLTQEELASNAGLKRTSIVLIEKGKQRLPIDRLYLISAALKCGLSELLPKLNEIISTTEKPVFNSKFDEYSEKLIKKEEKNHLLEKINALRKDNQ
jgi:transcriptional regulator with XRE-family HTH domain